MLYLVATPIGNLEDITIRALNTLRSCDYVLCEDTRHSGRLLKHFEISKPLKSFHKFNEAKREEMLISDLKSGLNVALISDAGTPCLSDPGCRLVARCVAEGIKIVPIPGACAAIAGLIGSGFDTDSFHFYGFLPKKSGQLTTKLKQILENKTTAICYESPHRILKVLKILVELDPDCPIVIARELTKKFEEFLRGTAQSLLISCTARPPKGELVVLFGTAQDRG
jgi:16S rRNA (cytidine1402-2'-O)-methyltransferase